MFVSSKIVLIVSAIIIVENVRQDIQYINIQGVNVYLIIAQFKTVCKSNLTVITVRFVNKDMYLRIHNAKKKIQKFPA